MSYLWLPMWYEPVIPIIYDWEIIKLTRIFQGLYCY